MRLKQRATTDPPQADLMPMIDMTFLLIAFFMVLLNFTEAEQDERINLPRSQLAKPIEDRVETPITLQVTADGTILYGGRPYTLEAARKQLLNEAQYLRAIGDSPAEATVIVRADADVAFGRVQELMEVCQDNDFEQFRLRAESDTR
ncbi:MAG: biopolymer transporter ExbD [Pirellulales bacterium]|nr:biopolymer transporter ExbD [Planctomycetales bacterium]